jgi:prevent-host-death family protein
MKTAAVTELKNRLSHYLRLVTRGETVTVLDRGKPIAQITPVPAAEDDVRRLAAEGLVRLPVRPLPKDFWRRSLPRSAASVSEALIEDRGDGDRSST